MLAVGFIPRLEHPKKGRRVSDGSSGRSVAPSSAARGRRTASLLEPLLPRWNSRGDLRPGAGSAPANMGGPSGTQTGSFATPPARGVEFMRHVLPNDLTLPEPGYWVWQNGWWAGLWDVKPSILDYLKEAGYFVSNHTKTTSPQKPLLES